MATTAGISPPANALVIEGNPSMRAILVAQLREYGVKTIVQCSRIVDARNHLEYRVFDIVLCELHFPNENTTGQDLLNDLRRNQLLPFSTVFVVITGEATYAKVAEAAEAALDGYLLKPHKPSQLGERLEQARTRKISLAAIFEAIEKENFEQAAKLCLDRFESKGEFWLYAARVGAELLLRTGQPQEARKLYEAVVEAKTLPWAKLGVARAMLDNGQMGNAVSLLETLIHEDPSYTDAYDVMGRAHFEAGRFDQALDTYKMACELTPASISRMQNLGMMSFYAGDRSEAERILSRTALLGLDSKMFDCQSLVLMAFVRLERSDHKGLQRCLHDFARLIENNPEVARYKRLAEVVDILSMLQHHKIAQALAAVRDMAKQIRNPEFDFESASNLLALLALMAERAIQLDEVTEVVESLGMRFCTSRSLSELLAGAASVHSPYAKLIHAAQGQVLKLAEHAMAQSLRGDPTAAVKELIKHGQETLNMKLIETATQVLDRYATKIPKKQVLSDYVDGLRARCTGSKTRVTLGEQKRQPGGLMLRIGGAAPKAASKPPSLQAGT